MVYTEGYLILRVVDEECEVLPIYAYRQAVYVLKVVANCMHRGLVLRFGRMK